MARARNIKPGFFVNDELAEVSPEGRLLFIGLWTLADREGRLKDRPPKIKVQVLPYDKCDVHDLLNQLQDHGFIVRYEVNSCKYIQVLNFIKHQNPHYKEVPSEIPPPSGHVDSDYIAIPPTEAERQAVFKRDGFKCVFCGATDDLTLDHVIPRSKGGSSNPDNLQTLCRSCNTSKGNKLDSDLNSLQSRAEIKASSAQVGTLIPDSLLLIPDSLNPLTDSLNPGEDKNNDNFQEVIKAFNNNIHPITPMEAETFAAWLEDGVEAGLIVWAIKQSVINGKRNARYIDAIIKNLVKEGITTLAGAEAKERDRQDFKEKGKARESSNKKPQLSTAEKAEIEKMNRQIAELEGRATVEH